MLVQGFYLLFTFYKHCMQSIFMDSFHCFTFCHQTQREVLFRDAVHWPQKKQWQWRPQGPEDTHPQANLRAWHGLLSVLWNVDWMYRQWIQITSLPKSNGFLKKDEEYAWIFTQHLVWLLARKGQKIILTLESTNIPSGPRWNSTAVRGPFCSGLNKQVFLDTKFRPTVKTPSCRKATKSRKEKPNKTKSSRNGLKKETKEWKRDHKLIYER